jgi:hypothetical protein
MTKVFCIGLYKTGTKTIARCLQQLGFNHHQPTKEAAQTLATEVMQGDYSAVAPLVEKYDAFGDWPWPIIYPTLARRFPDAKFILTLRESEDAWLASALRHAHRAWKAGHLREHLEFINQLTGADVVRSKLRLQHYYRIHAWGIRHFFDKSLGAPERLLTVNWGNPSTNHWAPLSEFLDKPVPAGDVPFPHENKSAATEPLLGVSSSPQAAEDLAKHLRHVMVTAEPQPRALPPETVAVSESGAKKCNISWPVVEVSDLEVNLLDSTGVLILRNVVPPEVVAKANEVIDAHFEKDPTAWSDKPLDKGCPSKFGFIELDPVFLDLMEAPCFLEAATYFLGTGFRFDHSLGQQMVPKLDAYANLHGGPQPRRNAIFFYVPGLPLDRGVVRTSQLKMSVQLTGQGPDTGGFCYIPGSHTSADYKDATTLASNFGKLLSTGDVTVPELNPGDVLIFPDSLVHGRTKQKGLRRTLYYSYTSGFSSFMAYDETARPLLSRARTEVQQSLLRAPYTTVEDPVTHADAARTPTVIS